MTPLEVFGLTQAKAQITNITASLKTSSALVFRRGGAAPITACRSSTRFFVRFYEIVRRFHSGTLWVFQVVLCAGAGTAGTDEQQDVPARVTPKGELLVRWTPESLYWCSECCPCLFAKVRQVCPFAFLVRSMHIASCRGRSNFQTLGFFDLDGEAYLGWPKSLRTSLDTQFFHSAGELGVRRGTVRFRRQTQYDSCQGLDAQVLRSRHA